MKCDRELVEASEKRIPAKPKEERERIVKASVNPARFVLDGPERGPQLTEAAVLAHVQKRTAHLGFAHARPSETEQERILGTNDLVDEFYLQRALAAARPVCRVTTRNGAGHVTGYATGFMVAPALLLTNWHVFKTADDAAVGTVEFDYTHAIDGSLVTPVEFALDPKRFYQSNAEHDFALVSVVAVSTNRVTQVARYGYHRLVSEKNKIAEKEAITIIQHPGGRRRQFAIRENTLKHIQKQFLLYDSDTAPGSSGAPAFNDSFQVVALHHSGRAAKDDKGLYILRDNSHVKEIDDVDESEVVWESNEGIRTSVLCDFFRANLSKAHPVVKQLFASMEDERGGVMAQALSGTLPPEIATTGRTPPRTGVTPAGLYQDGTAQDGTGQVGDAVTAAARQALRTGAGASSTLVVTTADGITIPLTVRVTVGAETQPVDTSTMTGLSVLGAEGFVQPEIDTDYSNRKGYQPSFLGKKVPLPKPKDMAVVSKLDDGEHEIPYEHFTVVMNKERRLALFCASNVDGDPAMRKPEPNKDYTRKGLTGLGKNDLEEWVTDPRIPEQHQLPDKFYNKDRQAFDKGHLVRREDMAWGEDFEQVRRGNNDTYHTTNCSPQVLNFNRSQDKGLWGRLENEILKQAKHEGDKYTLFCGPIFADDDRFFEGKDDRGDVKIQIPKRFWKVVVTPSADGLKAYAFVLEQNLKKVKFNEEFQVSQTWEAFLWSIADLEEELGLTFPKAVHDADQFDGDGADEIMRVTGIAPRAARNRRNGEREAPPVEGGPAS